jgi:anthranilate phosphoribosyltransferase
VPFEGLESWCHQARLALEGEGTLAEALRWNLAAYLWFAGAIGDLSSGLAQAEALLRSRIGLCQLERLRTAT